MTSSIRSALLCVSSVVLVVACGPSNNPPPPPDVAEDMVETDTARSPDAAPDVPVTPDVVTSETGADASIDAPPPTDTPPATDATPDRPAMDVPADARPDVPAVDVQPDRGVSTDVPVQGAVCGTRGVPPCGAGLYCNHPISAMCGATDLPGRCEPIPMGCTRELNPVCGCDMRTYNNPCLAAMAGVSVARVGMCAVADAGRTDAASTMCAAQDAQGVGACARFLGYVWNGSSCVGISGCSCQGSACGALYESPEACRAAYPNCDCRSQGCPAGRNCQVCRGAGGIVYACIPNGAVC